MSKELFLKRLVDCRIKSNLSQAQFAKIMNVSQATIARQETGVSSPSVDMLEKYADFFNCSTDYLLGRNDQPDAYFFQKGNPARRSFGQRSAIRNARSIEAVCKRGAGDPPVSRGTSRLKVTAFSSRTESPPSKAAFRKRRGVFSSLLYL